jgi:hypothetical protein
MNRPGGGSPRVGLLWRGDPAAPVTSGMGGRLSHILAAVAARGAEAVSVVFSDASADPVRSTLLDVDGVVVWVDPIMDGVNRTVLDGVLRDVAARGVYVSAHPDVILKMGTKDVLYTTRGMSWGTDIRLYASPGELRAQLPGALRGGPRVLKQHRGNGGNGVWRVELAAATTRELRLTVLHGLRGSVVQEMPLDQFLGQCKPYFANGACMVDQAFQPRLADGMVRCYLSEDRVVGFGHQMVTALLAPATAGAETPPPPPRLYYGADKAEFQPVLKQMQGEWVPELCRILDIDRSQLPAIWDADFLYGPRSADGEDTYVLCEINVSSVLPIPDESVEPLVDVAIRRSIAARSTRNG